MKRVLLGIVLVFPWAHPGAAAAASVSAATAEDYAADDDEEEEEEEEETGPAPRPASFGTLTANVGLTSDYLSRGHTMSDHRPALQAGADWEHSSGFSAGGWVSTIRIPEAPAPLEIDGYGSYERALGSFLHGSLGVEYSSFFNARELNALGLPVTLRWKDELTLGVSYAPGWGGEEAEDAWYVSAAWTARLPARTELTASAGYSVLSPESGLRSYMDVRVGVAREILGLTWDASASFVSRRQGEGSDDPRLVFAVSRTL